MKVKLLYSEVWINIECYIDRSFRQIQDYSHIAVHLLQEDSDTAHFLNMNCSGSSDPQLKIEIEIIVTVWF